MLSFGKTIRTEDDALKMKSLLDFLGTRYKDLSFEDIKTILPRDFPDSDVSEPDACYFTYKPYPDFDFTISDNPVTFAPPLIAIQGSWKFDGLLLTSVVGGTWFGRIEDTGKGKAPDATRHLLAKLIKRGDVKPSPRS